jgi:predicted nucleic acid-binding protein
MFDAEEFRLHLSPHILTNTTRVLARLGLSSALVEDYVEALLDVVAASGGQVIDLPRTVFDVSDFEDNLVLDLVVATDSLILVTEDTDLTELSPWNGRLLLRPREFVAHTLGSRRRP